MLRVDWAKIESEYIAGGVTYEDLSKKYGIPRKTISDKGRKGNWRTMRAKNAEKRAQRYANARARGQAKNIERKCARIEAVCEKLLKQIERAVADDDQFYRYLVEGTRKEVLEQESEVKSFDITTKVERVYGKLDTKSLRELNAAVGELLENIRSATGHLSPELKAQHELAREKLELEKKRVNVLEEESDSREIVVRFEGVDENGTSDGYDA